jgi:transposase
VNSLAFPVALVAAYAGKKVGLVCDNGRSHQTEAARARPEDNLDQVEGFWLPPYGPSPNRSERLGGHRKRTALANVLYATPDDLVAALRRGRERINGHKDSDGL